METEIPMILRPSGGGSANLTIPKDFRTLFGWKLGQFIWVKLDSDNKQLILRNCTDIEFHQWRSAKIEKKNEDYKIIDEKRKKRLDRELEEDNENMENEESTTDDPISSTDSDYDTRF